MTGRSRSYTTVLSILSGGLLLFPLGIWPASAQTLEEALANAYATNPTIEAQRAQLRATDEQVPQALSGYRPTLQATVNAGLSHQDTRLASGASTDRSLRQRGGNVSVAQPLYSGGRVDSGVKRAEALVQAQRANLLTTEQTVLLDGATAYLDIVRDQAVVDLNVNNEQVLRRQLDASQDRFNVGEITRTDVSQAQSRLSRAISDRIQAEGTLSASRAVYARVIGASPGRLEAPRLSFDLPASRGEAIELSQSNNPNVVAAEFSESASRNAVDQVRGEMLPSVNLRSTLSRNYGASALIDRSDNGSVSAEVTIPLYQAGATASRVREARHTVNQRRIQIEEARRQTVENAIRAWEGLTTARSTIQSRQSQVRASGIALEGVRQEALVGSRTILDTLDAEQELLDARVQLVQAQRDETVAAFSLLATVGQLTARSLNLPVQHYDYTAYYNRVRDKWSGTDVNE